MGRFVVFAMAVAVGFCFQSRRAVCSETEGAVRPHFTTGAPFLLTRAAEAIAHQLELLDRDLAEAASRLATLDLKQDAARAVIRQLQLRHAESVIDACTVSPRGIMLQVEPEPYRSFEGSDISDQEQIKTLMRTCKPVISRVFQTVEGVAAIDLEHPVIGSDGTYRGSVSVIFRPWVLIGRCVRDLVAGMPVEIWAMQPDGTIIYDADPREVERILFTDPKYRPFPELLQLGRRIAAQSEGDGFYSYFKAATSRVIRKNARWVSLSLHGTAWRLVIIHPAQSADTAFRAGAPPFSRQALNVLAEQPALIQALAHGDREIALKLLRQAAIIHTDIYSLSWVDARAVNRFGYPSQNSLFEIDLTTQTDPASVAIVQAIKQRRETEYFGPLVEGGQARFHLMPVLDGDRYLGSLLWIAKED